MIRLSMVRCLLPLCTGLVFLLTPSFLIPASSLAQSNVSALNLRLQQAISAQNWGQALQIIDQMIVATPDRSQELKTYRTQLQNLHRSGARIPAQAMVIPSTNTPSVGTSPASAPLPTGIVRIKRRSGGIPIIEVKMNNRVSFEMMLDSGASMTTITRSMAADLGITPAHIVDRVVFSTANGKVVNPIVYVGSMEAGGVSINRVPVAVAGPEMEMGLLGQDFMRRFDVTIRQNVVEFHPRQE
jgi:aspartyl protease family protein